MLTIPALPARDSTRALPLLTRFPPPALKLRPTKAQLPGFTIKATAAGQDFITLINTRSPGVSAPES